MGATSQGQTGLRRVGVIGLGKMGAPMARRLLAAGYRVIAHDVRPEAAAEVRTAGADSGDSPAAVAARADAVITMLPDARAVERVVYGERGLGEALGAGQVLLEMTSSQPGTTRRVAADLGRKGVRVLDCPVSGGVRGAVEGRLCVMVGGPAEVLEACRPILECFGDVVHVGDSAGDGDTAKTINNLLSATAVWSVVEAFVLGAKAGLAPDRLFAAVNRSTGRSYTTETKVSRNFLPRRFDAGFTVGQYLKDLDICLDLADDLGVPMLLGSMLRQAWTVAARDMADLDHTELLRLMERWARVGA
jgi:2-hydroxy-3-oxopropionate reductase